MATARTPEKPPQGQKMPWAGLRPKNRPLSRGMHKEKCRHRLRPASSAPVFANGAVTGAFSRAFNDEPLEEESTEDSVSASVTAQLHERLRAGIFVDKEGARFIFRLPVGKEFALTVNEDGIGKITVGGKDLAVNDKGLVDGAGVNIRAINITGRALNSREIQFTGRISIPLFANRVGLSLGITRSIDVESALLNNSGGLGQAARVLKGRTQRIERAICEQSGGSDC